jgi:putative DNA primase/helicase
MSKTELPENLRKLINEIDSGWNSKEIGRLLAEDGKDVIDGLARLPKLEYEKKRKETAKEFGIRASALDAEVTKLRSEKEASDAALSHWTIEPWEHPVDIAALLDDVTALFQRYLILPTHAAEGMALWTIHTWVFDSGDVSPFLVLMSPEKRCGKTKALTILSWITHRSELASNISSAALFRYIEDQQPTLLIDEGDSFLKENEEMRGILNSGHSRAAAYVIRCDGEDNKPRRFSTWAPKGIACIRKLADTLEDRSIIIPMQRKKRDAKVQRLRGRDNAEFATIRRKGMRWAEDHFEEIERAEPSIPDQLNDRAGDNWRPLLAIADSAGGKWPDRACKAAVVLSGDDAVPEDSASIELIADIHQAFDTMGASEMTTSSLLAELVKDDARPWAHWNKGKPMTAHALARMLKPYKIFSQEVSYPTRGQGYVRALFEQACAPYLPPSKLGSSGNLTGTGTSRNFQSSETIVHPSFEKGEETSVAVALPELPELCTPQDSRAHEIGRAKPAMATVDFPDLPPCLDRRLELLLEPPKAVKMPPVTRYVPAHLRPALGPPGDSLEDFEL